MADWVTISSLATATGTLVLASATFASVRSANRAARVAERSLLAGIRPLLVPTRFDEPSQKVLFVDDHALYLPGGQGAAEVVDDVVYLAIGLRNSGTGIAVLDRWCFRPERITDPEVEFDGDSFRRLNRDLYIAPNEIGFWQGAFRDPEEDIYRGARKAIEDRQPVTIDLLYGDYEGGQHTISRFALVPRGDDKWFVQIGRHRSLDRDNPR
jgi:hypothetical protein